MILDGGEADEVVHSIILDCEWWIAVGIILTMDGVVKVVAEQGSAFIWDCYVVVEQGFYAISFLSLMVQKYKKNSDMCNIPLIKLTFFM